MVYMQTILVPILSFTSILLSITPLILHAQNRNWPATCLICWCLALGLFNIVNAAIWPNDDIDTWWNGAGLCDVEVKIMVASYVAVPGNLLCIFRNLASVLDTRRATLVPTTQQRWRNHIIDVLFCIVAPVMSMVTHIVYQKSRYVLWGISGCVNSFDESWVSLVLSFMWPPIICFIAGYYCGLVLYRLHKYRTQFGNILGSANSNLSKSRFLRLFFLSFVMLLAIIPTQIFVVYKNIQYSYPWHSYSWRSAHPPSWGVITKWRSDGEVFFDRWIPIASGFLFFVFFGCGNDAATIHRSILRFLGFTCVQGPSLGTSPFSGTGYMNSRAKILGRKKWSSTSRTYVNNTTSTRVAGTIYEDLEMSTRVRHGPKGPGWLQWFRSSGVTPLTPPANPISTIAWAGTSMSRGSSEFTETPTRKDFIRVKQVINQESELQL
ncbi:pheromone A receptor-domain-containing protein [Aspergillus ambiguus]|uniref:pheromone receptor n=1 Tax=Aspergillus ambiguus TaxID=176160 RepID=UPI003CCCAE7B